MTDHAGSVSVCPASSRSFTATVLPMEAATANGVHPNKTISRSALA